MNTKMPENSKINCHPLRKEQRIADTE